MTTTRQHRTTPLPRHLPEDREKIPRILVRAVGIMLVTVLALTAYARITEMPLSATPPADVPVVAEKTVVITADMTGAATVRDISGALIADLPPEKGGFIAGVWRALALKREQAGVPVDAPVTLTEYADGRIALADAHTGWGAQLIGFGADNREAFAQLLK